MNFDEQLSSAQRPLTEELQDFTEKMILSVSGWRAVFNQSRDGESTEEKVSIGGMLAATLAASVLADYYKSLSEKPVLAFGTDSRPTGKILSRIMISELVRKEISVRYLSVTPAPEILAWTAREEKLDGFIYITASHNPPGYNGIKFGLGNGRILGGEAAMQLISQFRSRCKDREMLEEMVLKIKDSHYLQGFEKIESEVVENKKKAEEAYGELTFLTAFPGQQGEMAFREIRKNLNGRTADIVADLNGSARTRTIDGQWLESLGFRFRPMNTDTGIFVHPILPEGESLKPCLDALSSGGKESPALFGYVTDCDGDRGNIAIPTATGGRILEAQEGFALCVLTELAFLHWMGKTEKLAVAVNGPTSLRIKRIATAFQAEVFEAEVGEANIVSLADQLRSKGYTVRILGEGSNGGNITHPSQVRDPLQTVTSIIKLLFIRDSGGKPGLFQLWCRLSGQMEKFRQDYVLEDILHTLPSFKTTATDEPVAKLQIKKTHSLLKEKYEKLFLLQWDENKDRLNNDFGITHWEERNNEGSESRIGMGPSFRSGEQSGGLKIVLKNGSDQELGFLWMRGSGTEPVFRMLVDSAEDIPGLYETLLKWQTELIRKADL